MTIKVPKLYEVYMAYLNQVNVGAIEIVKRGVLTRDISEH